MSDERVTSTRETVPHGTDATSRATRRAWRERLNNQASRRMLIGVLVTFLGGAFWGFSERRPAPCSTSTTWTPCGS